MSAGTILIVEDNPDDESLILRALRKANVTNRIELVHDGAEALEYFFSTGRYEGRGETPPTVTLLDIKLPKVDGLEVLKRIRSDPKTAHLPIVILTSSDEQEDIVRSYRLHVNSYVRKPVEFHRFSEVVGQLGLYWLLVNERPPDLERQGIGNRGASQSMYRAARHLSPVLVAGFAMTEQILGDSWAFDPFDQGADLHLTASEVHKLISERYRYFHSPGKCGASRAFLSPVLRLGKAHGSFHHPSSGSAPPPCFPV